MIYLNESAAQMVGICKAAVFFIERYLQQGVPFEGELQRLYSKRQNRL